MSCCYFIQYSGAWFKFQTRKKVLEEYRELVITIVRRPSQEKQWLESQISAALDLVMKRMSGNKAAALHGVSPPTLKDWLSSLIRHGN